MKHGFGLICKGAGAARRLFFLIGVVAMFISLGASAIPAVLAEPGRDLSGRIAVVELRYDGSAYMITGLREESGFAPIPSAASDGVPLRIVMEGSGGEKSQIISLPTKRIAEGTGAGTTVMEGGFVPLEPYATVRLLDIPPGTKRISASIGSQVLQLKIASPPAISLVWFLIGSMLLFALGSVAVLYWLRRR